MQTDFIICPIAICYSYGADNYRDRTMNDFYANRYKNQVTEKDDHADADHLYNTADEDGEENDSQSKPL